MPTYSPSMLAKGFNCGFSLGEYRTVMDETIYLQLNDNSQRGTFYHSLIELWLREIKHQSAFPITDITGLRPSFNDFFSSGNLIRRKLSEINISISSQFTTFYDKFTSQCLVEDYLHAVVESEGISEFQIEEELPSTGEYFIDGNKEISLRGRPDCVIITPSNAYVIDWKTTIDESRFDYYGVQMKLYQLLVNSKTDKDSLGRIISILEAEDEDMNWPYLKSAEELTQITLSKIIQSSISPGKNPGEWCQNCKYNLKNEEVCHERARDSIIIENTERLLDRGFNPNTVIDVEFEKRHLRPNGKNLWIYRQDEEKEIFFKFKVNSLPAGDKIRCRGIIQHQRNTDRIFYVYNFVTL